MQLLYHVTLYWLSQFCRRVEYKWLFLTNKRVFMSWKDVYSNVMIRYRFVLTVDIFGRLHISMGAIYVKYSIYLISYYFFHWSLETCFLAIPVQRFGINEVVLIRVTNFTAFEDFNLLQTWLCIYYHGKHSFRTFRVLEEYILFVSNNNNNNDMLIVQYPMLFSGPPGNISNPCPAPLCIGEWWFNQHN